MRSPLRFYDNVRMPLDSRSDRSSSVASARIHPDGRSSQSMRKYRSISLPCGHRFTRDRVFVSSGYRYVTVNKAYRRPAQPRIVLDLGDEFIAVGSATVSRCSVDTTASLIPSAAIEGLSISVLGKGHVTRALATEALREHLLRSLPRWTRSGWRGSYRVERPIGRSPWESATVAAGFAVVDRGSPRKRRDARPCLAGPVARGIESTDTTPIHYSGGRRCRLYAVACLLEPPGIPDVTVRLQSRLAKKSAPRAGSRP